VDDIVDIGGADDSGADAGGTDNGAHVASPSLAVWIGNLPSLWCRGSIPRVDWLDRSRRALAGPASYLPNGPIFFPRGPSPRGLCPHEIARFPPGN
jgi:hypothetical protein